MGSPGFNKVFKEEAKNFKPRCCLYQTTNVPAPVRELGVSIARTPTYTQLHQTHLQEPEFFWLTSDVVFKRPILIKYRLLRGFSMRKSQAKAVP